MSKNLISDMTVSPLRARAHDENLIQDLNHLPSNAAFQTSQGEFRHMTEVLEVRKLYQTYRYIIDDSDILVFIKSYRRYRHEPMSM